MRRADKGEQPPGKLIVSIRQLDDLLDFLDLSNFGASLLSFDEQLILCVGGITWVLHGISWRWFDVIPPCLSGGLLSTQRGAASLCAALGNLYFASEFAGNPPGHGRTGLLIIGAISWHPFFGHDDGYASLFECFGDHGTFQLAGSHMFQQRQILLPVVSMLSNGFSSPSSTPTFPSSFWVAQGATTLAADHAAFHVSLQYQANGSSFSLISLPGEPAAQVCDQCRHFSVGPWPCNFRTDLDRMLTDIILWLTCCFNTGSVHLGTGLVAMRRSGCMLLLFYLCRLLFFGMRLKGGTCNCDNVLRIARSSTAAVPWHFGIGLAAYSPRLCARGAPHRRKRFSSPGYSADLYILLLLMAALIAPATAANSRFPSGQPTEFPVPPLHPDPLPDRGLLRNPDIAQDPVPQPWVFNPPPEVHVTRAYKLFAFGLQPEFYSSTTRLTTPAQRCLELIEPDVAASRTGGNGALHFLRGPAVLDELQAQWMPDWVHSSLGRLVIIDPSLLGLRPFQV